MSNSRSTNMAIMMPHLAKYASGPHSWRHRHVARLQPFLLLGDYCEFVFWVITLSLTIFYSYPLHDKRGAKIRGAMGGMTVTYLLELFNYNNSKTRPWINICFTSHNICPFKGIEPALLASQLSLESSKKFLFILSLYPLCRIKMFFPFSR